MKLRLLDFIVCPQCKCSFALTTHTSEQCDYAPEWYERVTSFWRQRSEAGPALDMQALWASYCTEIITGELRCESCAAVYPITGGIPCLLPPELRTLPGVMGRQDPTHDARIASFMDQIDPVHGDQDSKLFLEIQLANQSNYGYEWKAFSHQYEQWGLLYERNYIEETNEFFQGKLGLDAGCGNARYTLPPVSMGAEMVGVDLSNAIEMAYAKSRSLRIPTFHAIQGDIFHLPFRDDYFDFAQSLGVIHITPDPERALLSIKQAVKPGSKIFFMVYRTFESDNLFKHYLLKIVTFMRRFTSRMPSNMLYYFLYSMVPVVLIFLYFPSKFMAKIPWLKRFSTKLPYSYEQYGTRRLRDIHMNLFDRFGNPVERRYNRQQMEQWMQRAGFHNAGLRMHYGWNVTVVKPDASSVCEPSPVTSER